MADEADHPAVERGTHGDIRIGPDELDNSYAPVDDAGNVKAKVWQGDDGDRRLYLRVRDHDDGRRYNEYSVDLDGDGDGE